MRTRTKILLIVVPPLVASGAALAAGSHSAQQRLIEHCRTEQLQLVAAVLQRSLEDETRRAASMATLVSDLPEVKERFRGEARDALAKQLGPAFAAQKKSYGVLVGQFHVPPATTFLHLMGVNKPGEDLSAFRDTVVAANRKGEMQLGVEIGVAGLGIRGVVPVSDGTGPIGTFEVGLDFSTVATRAKQTTGFDIGVFVDHKKLAAIASKLPTPSSDRIVGELRNIEATDWQVIRSVATTDLLAQVHDVRHASTRVDAVDYGVVLVPLLDFSGRQIGVIVATRSFEHYGHEVRASVVNALSLCAAQIVIVVGALLLVVGGLLLRPLRDLAAAFSAHRAGRDGPDLGELVKRSDEIGALAREAAAIRTGRADGASAPSAPPST